MKAKILIKRKSIIIKLQYPIWKGGVFSIENSLTASPEYETFTVY